MMLSAAEIHAANPSSSQSPSASSPPPPPPSQPSVEPAHREENDCIIVTIPKDYLWKNYLIDVQSIMKKNHNINDSHKHDSPREPTPIVSNPLLPAPSRRRRRDELEEYDLDDPFIDDTEILPMGNWQDYLQDDEGHETNLGEEPISGGGGSGEGYVRVTNEFYVWRGRLPDRPEDPLWAEKIDIKDSRKRTKSENTAKTKKASNEKKPSKKRKTEPNHDDNHKDDNRNLSPEQKNKTKRIPKKKKPKSILEKIAELGDTEEVDDNNGIRKSKSIPADKDEIKIEEREGEEHNIDIIEEFTKSNESKESTIAITHTVNHLPSSHNDSIPPSQTPPPTEEAVRKRYDYTTPLVELECRLAMESLRSEAGKTVYTDPKKLPSSLRPLISKVIVTQLCHQAITQKRIKALPKEFFVELSSFLPYSAASLEKLTFNRLLTLQYEELVNQQIPRILDELKNEAHLLHQEQSNESGKKSSSKFTDKVRQYLLDAMRLELDAKALELLIKSHQEEKSKALPYSEQNIRKAFYIRLQGCWPAETITTIEIGKEYANLRRRYEMRKLKEYKVQVHPTLVPIKLASHKKVVISAKDVKEEVQSEHPPPENTTIQQDMVNLEPSSESTQTTCTFLQTAMNE